MSVADETNTVIIGSKFEDGTPGYFKNGDIITDRFGNEATVKLSDDHVCIPMGYSGFESKPKLRLVKNAD